MDKFLIFGLARSGTTSLLNALNKNGNVMHEPFKSDTGEVGQNRAFTRLLEVNGYLPEQLPEPANDAWHSNRFHYIAADRTRCHAWLEQLYAEFTGIKHVWNTVSRQANLNILDWCKTKKIKLIFQTRENLARSLLSTHLAQQSQIWQFGPEFENEVEWRDFKFEDIDLRRFRLGRHFLFITAPW